MIVTIVAVKESEGPVYLCGESTTYTTVAFGGYVEIALLSVPFRWARRLTVTLVMRCVVFLAHACYNLSENCHGNLQNIDGGGKGTGGEGRPR